MSEHQQDYNVIAAQYDRIELLPHSHISEDLVRIALGDCTNQVILDLGGGSGLHARNAIALGAANVHIVDISSAMLERAAAAEERAERKPGDKVLGLVGDATQSLDHLNLTGRPGSGGLYDVVMMNWTFDHATTGAELGTMWANVAKFTRPGGKIVSIRATDPRAHPKSSKKYGVVSHDFEAVEGGVRYDFTIGFEQPVTARSTDLEANFNLEMSRELARRWGFDGLEVVDASATEAVKKDPEFWSDFIAHPGFVCVVGTKMGEEK